MQLGEIAEIKTGLVLRRKKAEVDFTSRASYKLFSLKNISDDGMIENETFDEFFSIEKLDEHYFTETGDILMRLNQPYTAVYIDENHTGLLVPSYFVIIKIHEANVLPKYVAWYLNTSTVRNELDRAHAGSRIPTTNRHVIKNISITLPTIEEQEKLINLYELHLKEKQLYKKLLKEKERYFYGVVEQILGGINND